MTFPLQRLPSEIVTKILRELGSADYREISLIPSLFDLVKDSFIIITDKQGSDLQYFQYLHTTHSIPIIDIFEIERHQIDSNKIYLIECHHQATYEKNKFQIMTLMQSTFRQFLVIPRLPSAVIGDSLKRQEARAFVTYLSEFPGLTLVLNSREKNLIFDDTLCLDVNRVELPQGIQKFEMSLTTVTTGSYQFSIPRDQVIDEIILDRVRQDVIDILPLEQCKTLTITAPLISEIEALVRENTANISALLAQEDVSFESSENESDTASETSNSEAGSSESSSSSSSGGSNEYFEEEDEHDTDMMHTNDPIVFTLADSHHLETLVIKGTQHCQLENLSSLQTAEIYLIDKQLEDENSLTIRNCPSLKSLTITHCSKTRPCSITLSLPETAAMKVLLINTCCLPIPPTINTYSINGQQLLNPKSFNIIKLPSMSAMSRLIDISEPFENLTHLSLHVYNKHDRELLRSCYMPRLHSMMFYNNDPSSYYAYPLLTAPKLHEVHLMSVKHDSHFKDMVRSFPSLKALSVNEVAQCTLTPEVDQINNYLKVLEVTTVDSLRSAFDLIRTARYGLLRTLKLTSSFIHPLPSDFKLSFFAPKLLTLDITMPNCLSDQEQIRDQNQSLKNQFTLEGFPNLQKFKFISTFTKVTVSNCPSLEVINIPLPYASDSQLKLIGSFEKLRVINLGNLPQADYFRIINENAQVIDISKLVPIHQNITDQDLSKLIAICGFDKKSADKWDETIADKKFGCKTYTSAEDWNEFVLGYKEFVVSRLSIEDEDEKFNLLEAYLKTLNKRK
ncbi:hypothetical protein WICPIJ_007264 [Wickerhamomyces pijperi]|uniref:F-box domain-containing protein n=1 Tax=Wickerhamomyces pijperi TaxID=599730 RepID=A0A9P8TK88_WICPI|nr:hypothetical protein WICPIJ_007264 [Wickerhamomyces pijperi]